MSPVMNPSEAAVPSQPDDFSPFYTLISTSSNSASSHPTNPTIHHPKVHYIFADDDPDRSPITAAALDILDPLESATSPQKYVPSASGQQKRTSRRTNQESHATATAPPGQRFILLDLDSSGTQITNAQSMSPDWAVVHTEVSPAPTWEEQLKGAADDSSMPTPAGQTKTKSTNAPTATTSGALGAEESRTSAQQPGKTGLMLKITGVQGRTTQQRVQSESMDVKQLESLAEHFERGMVELRKVASANTTAAEEVFQSLRPR